MKKKLVYFTVAALAMASCSNDEVLEANYGSAINFRASSDKNSRATETTNANLTGFYVTAFTPDGSAYFSNQLFEGSQGNSYISDPVYYWPSDQDLTFHAYAPESNDFTGTLSFTSAQQTLTNFSPASEISDQIDLIYATATGNKESNEATGVQLSFNHMLSQIELQAKNTNSGYVYKIKGVKIGKPVSQGTLDFSTTDWEPSTTKAVYKVVYNDAITLNETAQSIMAKVDGKSDNAMLIPQQLTAWNPDTDGINTSGGAYLSVLVDIDTKDGANVYPIDASEFAWASVGINTKWEAGKKYIYIMDFSSGAGNVDPEQPGVNPDDPQPGDPILGKPITFTVNVIDWTPANQEVDM